MIEEIDGDSSKAIYKIKIIKGELVRTKRVRKIQMKKDVKWLGNG